MKLHKENAKEKDRDRDGDNISGKQWRRRKEEHGRELRSSSEKTQIGGGSTVLDE
jgi:hypothetical protein